MLAISVDLSEPYFILIKTNAERAVSKACDVRYDESITTDEQVKDYLNKHYPCPEPDCTNYRVTGNIYGIMPVLRYEGSDYKRAIELAKKYGQVETNCELGGGTRKYYILNKRFATTYEMSLPIVQESLGKYNAGYYTRNSKIVPPTKQVKQSLFFRKLFVMWVVILEKFFPHYAEPLGSFDYAVTKFSTTHFNSRTIRTAFITWTLWIIYFAAAIYSIWEK